jgi:dTDP-4-amino-4,6-dideoxygalactose transaminase
MQNHGIYGRRYFYPLINELQMYQNIPSANINNLPVANRIKEQVICLPIYPTLTDDDVARVVECIVCNEVT